RAGRIQLVSAAVGIVATDRSADRRLARVYVGGRADPDIHLLAGASEEQAARPVAVGLAGQRDDFFAFTGGQLRGVVGVAFDRAGLGHVEIILPAREAVWTVEPLDQLYLLCGITAGEDVDGSRGAAS